MRLDPIGMERVVDTLALARRKHPGSPNSLDALCGRYRIDNSRRTKHGALLDAEILSEVYVELVGGRQATLVLATEVSRKERIEVRERRARLSPLPPLLSDAEAHAHAQYILSFGDKSLWRDYTEE
jgi:DNA polymerase-3 subunit epsilon